MRFVHHRTRWLIGIALLALLAGGWWWQAAEARAWQRVGAIDPLWVTTPHHVEVDGQAILLTFVGGRLTAFRQQDPHPGGCLVVWDRFEERFIDPCLGSAYKHDGTYVRGP